MKEPRTAYPNELWHASASDKRVSPERSRRSPDSQTAAAKAEIRRIYPRVSGGIGQRLHNYYVTENWRDFANLATSNRTDAHTRYRNGSMRSTDRHNGLTLNEWDILVRRANYLNSIQGAG